MAVIDRVGDDGVLERLDLAARTLERFEGGSSTVRSLTDEDVEWLLDRRRFVQWRRSVNQASLTELARAALAVDQAYEAKVQAGTATTADHVAHVPRLNRQVMALIRLVVASDLLD